MVDSRHSTIPQQIDENKQNNLEKEIAKFN